MEHRVNIRVKSGNREQESREEEGEQLRLEMQAHLERPCKSRDAVELDPEPLKWFKLGSGMIKCVLLKGHLGCSCKRTGFSPRLIFSTWFPAIRFREMGMYWNSGTWWLGLSLKMNWSRANLMAPPSIPPPSILIQAPRVLVNVKGRFEEGRGNDSLVPYTPGQFTEEQISIWWARFSNKFALFISVPFCFCCS